MSLPQTSGVVETRSAGPHAGEGMQGHGLAALQSDGRPSSKKPKIPRPTELLSCPRCGGSDTKFCYYNNYNVSQPRYYCKVSGASRHTPC